MVDRFNSATNPSAAGGVTGWTLTASPAPTQATGLSGPPRTTGSQSAAAAGAYSAYLCGGRALTSTSGQTWSLTGWVMSTVARTLRCYLATVNGNAIGTTVSSGSSDVVAAAGVWYQVRLVQVTPTGTYDNIRLHVDLINSATGPGTIYMSSVRIEQISDAALDYADGDTSGWVWDGATGASTSRTATVAPPTPPSVNAGADAAGVTGTAWTRTATESGGTPTSRAWTIVSGPTGAGTTLATTAALSWTPSTAGTYVLRYTATNAGGSDSDDVTLTVTAPPVDPGAAGGAFPSAPNLYPGTSFSYPNYVDATGTTPPDPGLPTLPPPPLLAPPAPMLSGAPPRSQWTFGFGPAREGGLVYELPQSSSRKLSVKLTDNSEASIEIDGRDPVAVWIDELATDLHVLYRRSPADPRQQLYRGRIGKTSDRGTVDTHRLVVPSLDYRALLKRRFLFTGSQQTWTQVDQGLIAWGLITQAQNALGPDGTAATGGGDMGIELGDVITGVLRDRSYELGDEISAKITELSEVIDGFDWDILTPDSRRLVFEIWYPQRGVNRGVEIEFGGAATEFSRDVDSTAYANAIRMTGQAPSGGGTEPPPYERYADDILTAPQGRWDAVIGSDVTTAAGVSDRIDWQLGESQAVRPSYTFTMKRGWWQGPEHCWLGDPVSIKIFSGRLRVDELLRVQQMDFTPSPDGGEDVAVTIGAPKPDPRKRTSSIEQRLATLERR